MTNEIDQGYFQTIGIGMIAGRDFTSIDLPRESATAIITESLAKHTYPPVARRSDESPAARLTVPTPCASTCSAVYVEGRGVGWLTDPISPRERSTC